MAPVDSALPRAQFAAMKREIVIVGAGHAGVQAAASLRDEGFDGTIRLIDAGRELPYQRPPSLWHRYL
jgi:3-phenylpropionate/trans-cinnamate dioxygenase ferredoxin reductase subunit